VDSPVESHIIVIKPTDFKEGVFHVRESVRLSRASILDEFVDGDLIRLPEQDMKSQPSGFFLRKLRIPGPANRTLDIEIDKGVRSRENMCGYYCTEIYVILEDFAAQAFHSANVAKQPEIPSHPEPVTIEWSVPSFYSGRSQDIIFWYYPSRSLLLTKILRPFAGITSLEGLALVLAGAIGTLFITPFIVPALKEIVQRALTKKVVDK
jgi:hypothetical protein